MIFVFTQVQDVTDAATFIQEVELDGRFIGNIRPYGEGVAFFSDGSDIPKFYSGFYIFVQDALVRTQIENREKDHRLMASRFGNLELVEDPRTGFL